MWPFFFTRPPHTNVVGFIVPLTFVQPIAQFCYARSDFIEGDFLLFAVSFDYVHRDTWGGCYCFLILAVIMEVIDSHLLKI
jgi:hypothetical protein